MSKKNYKKEQRKLLRERMTAAGATKGQLRKVNKRRNSPKGKR